MTMQRIKKFVTFESLKRQADAKLNFTLDYDGVCEEIWDYEVKGQDFTDDISEDDVDGLVAKLENVPGFRISPHRTEVWITWRNGKMDIDITYYHGPDESSKEDIELKNIPEISLD
jgi:hypothetical protein